MVDLVEFSVVDITKGRMDIQLCGHGDLGRSRSRDRARMSSKSSNLKDDRIKWCPRVC